MTQLTPLRIFLSAMVIAIPPVGLVANNGGSNEAIRFSDVKTQFAANLPLWWDKKTPVEQKITEAHELGFKAVEFWGYQKEDIDAIERTCKRLGVQVTQFSAWGKPLTSGENIDAFEAGIKDAIKVAKRLGVQKMTVTGHKWTEGLSHQEQLENYKSALLRVQPLCEAAQVMIIIEPFNPINHGKNALNGSKDALRICREINSPMIKINWDFYHMQLTEGALVLHLQDGIDQVGYLQLGDTPGRNQPGTGELNYKFILKAAYDLGYRGFVGVECRPKGPKAAAVQQLLENSY